MPITRLSKFLREREGKPFKWGQTDCNVLALQCLDILTGMTRPHFALIAQGRYSTEAGALAFATTYPMSLGRILAMAGAQEVKGDCQPGDFILVQREGEPWLRAHICLNDSMCASSTPEHGIIIIPCTWVEPGHTIMRL